jgi:hypothetical protein
LLIRQTRFAKFNFILRIAEDRKTPPLSPRLKQFGLMRQAQIRRRAFDRVAIVLKAA